MVSASLFVKALTPITFIPSGRATALCSDANSTESCASTKQPPISLYRTPSPLTSISFMVPGSKPLYSSSSMMPTGKEIVSSAELFGNGS